MPDRSFPGEEPPNENRLCYELADLKNGFSPDPKNFYEITIDPLCTRWLRW